MTSTPSRTVVAEPLTSVAFSPFGSVVSAGLFSGSSANQGTAVRFDRCAAVTSTRPTATANLAVFRSTAKALPFSVQLLERHPCSTQTFLPMICTRFLIVVSPTAPDGNPDLAGLRSFLCGPGQGISYAVGVWHHPIIAIDGDADFVMLAWEDGTARDCVEHLLTSSVLVTAP